MNKLKDIGMIIEPKTVVLTRNNLLSGRLKTPIEEITISDFKYDNDMYLGGMKVASENSIIMFVDEAGQTSILKNRYGNSGIVIDFGKSKKVFKFTKFTDTEEFEKWQIDTAGINNVAQIQPYMETVTGNSNDDGDIKMSMIPGVVVVYWTYEF